ncbi:hypothetical protein GC173_07725 [bacterium]|nr:hypothetical protein [bacterium]
MILSPRLRARCARLLEWLPALVVLPFLAVLWVSVLGRVGVRWELEWNEGQSVEQAWRFAAGLPLYPKVADGWVPYMYAPLYHMLLGLGMRWTSVDALPLGRFLSVLGMVAAQWAVFQIVYDRTRRASAALFAVGLTAIWYKASGLSWDLVRVDGLAIGLAMVGLAILARPRRSDSAVIVGMLVLALAVLAKQNLGLLAVACTLQLVFLRPRATILGGALVGFLVINFVFLMIVSGNSEFLKYTVTNASHHLSRHDVFFPGAFYPDRFRAELPDGVGWFGTLDAYIALWLDKGPPEVWKEFVRHWALTLGIPGLALAWSVLRRRRAHWWFFMLPVAALLAGAITAWAKFGGFSNNFLPFYVGWAILLSLCAEWLRRQTTGLMRMAIPVTVAALVLLQIVQPWALPDAKDEVTRYVLADKEGDVQARSLVLETGVRRMRPLTAGDGARPLPWWADAYYDVSRIESAGLLWLPSRTWPAPDSDLAFAALGKWLDERRALGENVWVMHHQWYAMRRGHPAVMNVDMARCAEWAGDPIPPQLLDKISDGGFQWIVLDMEDITYEWLPLGVRQRIQAGYQPIGPVPGLAPFVGTNALLPTTGARMRPLYAWRSNALAAPDTQGSD